MDLAIESSPSLRAWQTARAVADEADEFFEARFVLEEEAALSERCLGAAANLTTSEIEAVVRRDPRYDELPHGWKRDPDFRLPLLGAESLREAGRRVAAHLEASMANLTTLAEAPTLKLFVGHGGAFRLAAAELGILRIEETHKLSMHYCSTIWLEYESPGSWKHVEGQWKVRALESSESSSRID